MSLPRAKRAGEDFTRTHHNEAGGEVDGPSSSKKPRFDTRNPSTLAPDAPEDDAILDADVIGRRGQQVRRNAVNIDGYDSDSENEGFDARVEAKAKEMQEAEKGKGAGGDDDDMFAELEEDFAAEEPNAGEKKKGKKVRFLQPDEIEDQFLQPDPIEEKDLKIKIETSNAKGSVADKDGYSSDSSVEEQERAKVGEEVDEELGAGGKKARAPLLDAFNMRTEQQEGRFDDQGNYIRKAADPDAVHDSWLEGLSRKDMRKAKEAAEKRDEERRQRALANDSILTGDVLKTLIPFLERGETILEALARLGKGQERKPKWQNKNKAKNKNKLKNGTEDVEMAEENPEAAARKRAIETVTETADILLTRGQVEIYDASKELLIRQYKRETGEDWVDEQSSTTAPGGGNKQTWEFRWSDARDGGAVHGPYEGTMMESWNNAGYFGEGVEFRRVGDSGSWSKAVDFSQ